MRLKHAFHEFASRVSHGVGSPWAFAAAVFVVVMWLVSGPIFRFSDTWQLAINTGTTIVTFLMVFLIQNTQNRDARALHLKLDELIRALRSARNELIDLEHFPDEEIDRFAAEFEGKKFLDTDARRRQGTLVPQDRAGSSPSRAPQEEIGAGPAPGPKR
jgi:low affinity Fe/Cu permease